MSASEISVSLSLGALTLNWSLTDTLLGLIELTTISINDWYGTQSLVSTLLGFVSSKAGMKANR